jgi:biotin carboxyl carrier protein
MRVRYEWDGNVYELQLERKGNDSFQAVRDGTSYKLEVLNIQPGQVTLLIDGRPVTIHWADEGSRKWISSGGCTYILDRPSATSRRRSGDGDTAAQLRAPMPAQVRSIDISEGDPVERGQTLLLLEAMKMEIRIKAPRAGHVTRVLAAEGQTVERDQLLVELAE